MLKCLIVIVLISTTYVSSAQTRVPEWHLVRVFLEDASDEELLHELGLEFDHAHGQRGRWMDAHLTDESLKRLRDSQLDFEVLQRNMQSWYAARIAGAKPSPDEILNLPAGMQLGSVGGFYRLDEAYAEMERLRARFANLVSGPDTLGFTFEGRPILAWNVHDTAGNSNPDTVPELLITALHHAREPASVTTVLYGLWEILGRYAQGDSEVRRLLATRRLIVIPILNPDGWAFNLRLTPGGGGLWRKNARRHEDGEIGVDLNRNYGPDSAWDAENGGSSVETRSELYRGPEAFSEPETRAVRDLCARRNILVALNFHSFGELYIQPFSFSSANPDDSLAYDAFFATVSSENGYAAGRDVLTVRYNARGVSDDWMRLGSGIPAPIRALTPEVGSANDGFWPSRRRIPEIGRENLLLIEEAWWSAGANLKVMSLRQSLNSGSGDSLFVRLQNIGAQAVKSGALVRILDEDSRIAPLEELVELEAELGPGAALEVAIPLMLNADWQAGSVYELRVQLDFNDVSRSSAHALQVGQSADINLPADGWTTDQGWGTEFDPTSGSEVLSDSPMGAYARQRRRTSQFSAAIDLTGAGRATLQFEARWQIEANFDGFFMEVSRDGGLSWRALNTLQMNRATNWAGSAQESGRWYLQGARIDWTALEVPLDQFIGENIWLRCGLVADGANQFDGIQLRRIQVRRYGVSGSNSLDPSGLQVHISPNPLAFDAPLQIDVGPETALRDARVQIFNVLGAKVFERMLVDVPRRAQSFLLEPNSLGTGRYILVFRNELGGVSRPFLIIR